MMNVHVVLGGHQPNHHWEAHPAVISSYTLLKDAENWSESGKQRTAARWYDNWLRYKDFASRTGDREPSLVPIRRTGLKFE